jgi:serine protease AprX
MPVPRLPSLALVLVAALAVMPPEAGDASLGGASLSLPAPFVVPAPWAPSAWAGMPGDARWAALAAAASPLLCVLDSGLDAQHADLAGRVVAWHDFVHGRREPYDDNGHGTHVAGIAAGAGLGEASHRGQAPRALLAAGKVTDHADHGTSGMAAAGLRWCAALGADVVNLSLEEDACGASAGLAQAVRAARDAGALVVVAAGNHGAAPCAIHAPGSLAEALTVGALAGSGLDAGSVAGFSGRGSPGQGKPDVAAPGLHVVSAAAGTRDGYRSLDGTSMAAPYVAGVAGLLRAAHPEASPQRIADALRATAQNPGPTGWDPAWGWGAVRPGAALAWLDEGR